MISAVRSSLQHTVWVAWCLRVEAAPRRATFGAASVRRGWRGGVRKRRQCSRRCRPRSPIDRVAPHLSLCPSLITGLRCGVWGVKTWIEPRQVALDAADYWARAEEFGEDGVKVCANMIC